MVVLAIFPRSVCLSIIIGAIVGVDVVIADFRSGFLVRPGALADPRLKSQPDTDEPDGYNADDDDPRISREDE